MAGRPGSRALGQAGGGNLGLERAAVNFAAAARKKTGARRRPHHALLAEELHVVGSLAVRVDVEAFAFLFLADPQTHEKVGDEE